MPHSENPSHDSSPADRIVHERDLLPDEYTQRCRRLLALFHDGTNVAPSLFQPEKDEMRIAMAVRRVMGVSLEYWAGLSAAHRLPLLDETIKVIAAEQAEVQDQQAVAVEGEGGPPATLAEPFAELRQFARSKLKGQERAVVEALCDAGGELPIGDLAVKDGVGWEDSYKGFEGVQRRLNLKIKKQGWTLTRQDNNARLTTTAAEDQKSNPAKDPLKSGQKAGE